MKKPVIGVLPLWDEEKQSVWMLPGYMQGIEAAGGIPVVLSLTADEAALTYWAESLDGFLFTGGQDADPALYGERKLAECGDICRLRDDIEIFLFNKVLELDKPAFGICRGLQLFNVALGGTLYQDIPTQMTDPLVHEGACAKDIAYHTVSVVQSTLLHRIAGDTCMVNSYHHQGIKGLAAGLQAAAVAQDGLVECVYMPGRRYVFAVQWHPELNFASDSTSMALFKALTDAAKTQ